MKTFRKGVCGIFMSADGRILLGERRKEKGQWQLPQGGIEGNETPIEALHREMEEEVGVTGLKILRDTGKFISYHWPEGLFPSTRYHGQEHVYFLLDGAGIEPMTLVATEEFARFAWFSREQVLAMVVEWKRGVYVVAFQSLNL